MSDKDKPLAKIACKTIEIPRVLAEAAASGLITDECLQALEHEKLKAGEEIERLRDLYRQQLISHEQMEMGIRGIREEMQQKILALDFDNT